MAVNRTFKIPRDVLAQITGNNPQAIKAFENIEATSNAFPDDMADIVIRIESAEEQAEQSTIIANQVAAIISQAIADIRPTLNAVSVPLEPSDYLQAVSVSIDCQNQIIPV